VEDVASLENDRRILLKEPIDDGVLSFSATRAEVAA